ncbi:MAG: hypothetical protein ACYDFT_05665 [Thermoplasmata archaeon]
MPQSTLSYARTVRGMDPAPSPEAIREILFRSSKAELVHWEGDALELEVTPDRLDLLSEGGLGQHLEGLLGRSVGLPAWRRRDDPDPTLSVEVAASVAQLRPYLGAIGLHAPEGHPLDRGLLEEAVRFQELLHATLGLDRSTASLGIYPAGHLRSPLVYAMEPIGDRLFEPLDGNGPVPLAEFLHQHPLAQRYGIHGRTESECLILRDADGQILSVPPILNSGARGRAQPGDRQILLESTGRRAARVDELLGLLALPFLASGWEAEPVRVQYPDRTEDGRERVRPREIPLDPGLVRHISGLEIPPEEMIAELRRARLGADLESSGFRVEVPPWRPDLQAPVDLVEDLLLARGLRPEEGRLPPSRTRGRRLRSGVLRRAISSQLLGLGFVPLLSPVLVPERTILLLGRDPVSVANPVSLEYARVRDCLLVPLVTALGANVRYGYPQRMSEVGPVVHADPEAESGARTDHHAAFLLASEGVGFADAAAFVEYLLRRATVSGVREPARLPGTIAGRAARVRLAGEVVAELGEIHPSVLDQLGVPVPAVWGELDLTALEPLLRGE